MGWLAVVLCYVIQILSNIGAIFTNSAKGQAALSSGNPTYATPDGITFSIWGLIYTFEFIAAVYQAVGGNRNLPQLVNSRHWICAAFLANAAWLPVFQNQLWIPLQSAQSVRDARRGVCAQSKRVMADEGRYLHRLQSQLFVDLRGLPT